MLEFIGLAIIFASTSIVRADVDVTLGSIERTTRLFAFPNNCDAICFRNWTLEQTIEHYLTQSVQRDGYNKANVSVKVDNHQIHVAISGVPDDYGKPLEALLAAGDLACKDAVKMNADGKWAYNWRLFVPLGMALKNRKSVQLLHFPPDYSLTREHDYLKSATSDRWAMLLTANGIPSEQTPAYQTIIDIAPIAAPSTAGKDLEGVYDYFTDYQITMVKELSQTTTGVVLPMVAFGEPVRKWIKQQYNVTIGVLGLGEISPIKGVMVPILGSNHPSKIWYAADPKEHDGDESKADAAGLKIMGDDLSVACWQARLGSTPGSDPEAQLKSCKEIWQVQQWERTCELFYTSIRKLTIEQAKAKCLKKILKKNILI